MEKIQKGKKKKEELEWRGGNVPRKLQDVSEMRDLRGSRQIQEFCMLETHENNQRS